jgi:hypothetical protein
MFEICQSARKHGISNEDIRHALDYAMAIEDQEDDLRLYIGPARNAELLEVATLPLADQAELVIHAMKMRSKYKNLLPRE